MSDKKGTFIFNSMINNMRKFRDKGNYEALAEYLFAIIDYDQEQKPYTGNNELIDFVFEGDKIAIDNANKRQAASSNGGKSKYNTQIDMDIEEAITLYKFKSKIALIRFLGISETTGREHLNNLNIPDEAYIDRNLKSDYEAAPRIPRIPRKVMDSTNRGAESDG
jgi:hypothetical protein